nr:uncharacterized protein LOC121124187 [Lepeophtheirus salmonis]
MSSTTQYSTFKNAPKEELQWTGGARSLSHVQEEQEGAADSPSCCHTLTEYIKWFVFNVLYVCCPCWDASSYFVNEDGNRRHTHPDNIDDPSINRDRVRLLQPRDSSLSLASDSSTLERSAARRSNRPKPPPDPKNCGPPSDYHQNIPLKIKTEESSAAVGPPLPPRTNRPPPSSGDDGPRKRAGSTSNPGRSRREQVDLRKVAVSSGKGLPPIFGTNGKRSLSCAQLSSKNPESAQGVPLNERKLNNRSLSYLDNSRQLESLLIQNYNDSEEEDDDPWECFFGTKEEEEKPYLSIEGGLNKNEGRRRKMGCGAFYQISESVRHEKSFSEEELNNKKMNDGGSLFCSSYLSTKC